MNAAKVFSHCDSFREFSSVKELSCTDINVTQISRDPSGLCRALWIKPSYRQKSLWLFWVLGSFFLIGSKMHEANVPEEVSTSLHLPYWEGF